MLNPDLLRRVFGELTSSTGEIYLPRHLASRGEAQDPPPGLYYALAPDQRQDLRRWFDAGDDGDPFRLYVLNDRLLLITRLMKDERAGYWIRSALLNNSDLAMCPLGADDPSVDLRNTEASSFEAPRFSFAVRTRLVFLTMFPLLLLLGVWVMVAGTFQIGNAQAVPGDELVRQMADMQRSLESVRIAQETRTEAFDMLAKELKHTHSFLEEVDRRHALMAEHLKTLQDETIPALAPRDELKALASVVNDQGTTLTSVADQSWIETEFETVKNKNVNHDQQISKIKTILRAWENWKSFHKYNNYGGYNYLYLNNIRSLPEIPRL